MANLIDYILDLFRNPEAAAAYVADPEGAMRDAGVPPVSPAQFQAVAAAAAPAGVVMGGGDPVVGLQRAVADHHQVAQNFASPFSPQTNFAPATEVASRNNTDVASHNPIASNNDTSFMSPPQSSGANSQQGGFNLGFGDITFGDKTTQTATDGGVVVGGAEGRDRGARGPGEPGDDLRGGRVGSFVRAEHPRPALEEVGPRTDRARALAAGHRVAADIALDGHAGTHEIGEDHLLDGRDVGDDGLGPPLQRGDDEPRRDVRRRGHDDDTGGDVGADPSCPEVTGQRDRGLRLVLESDVGTGGGERQPDARADEAGPDDVHRGQSGCRSLRLGGGRHSPAAL